MTTFPTLRSTGEVGERERQRERKNRKRKRERKESVRERQRVREHFRAIKKIGFNLIIVHFYIRGKLMR